MGAFTLTNYVSLYYTFTFSVSFDALLVKESNIGLLHIIDTRSDNFAPSYYYTNHPRRILSEFKLRNTIGVTSGVYHPSFVIVITIVPWHDESGGRVTQYIFDAKILRRVSTSTANWTGWETVG